MSMNTTSPPRSPALVGTGGNGGSRRLQLRLQKIVFSVLTVIATAWCITLGPVPAVLACAVAKHVLVAVLVMGYDVVESPA
jgi:hypothetical protein